MSARPSAAGMLAVVGRAPQASDSRARLLT